MSDNQKGEFVFGAAWAESIEGSIEKPDSVAHAAAEKKVESTIREEATESLTVEDLSEVGATLEDNPLLGQGEIDSLLEDTPRPQGTQKGEGLKLLVESRHLTAERLPALESIYERFARLVSVNLRYFTSENVDVSFGKLVPIRFGDYMETIPWPSLLVVFKAEEWESRGLITLDNPLIYSVVDILHGGRRARQMRYEEGKPYTMIETRLIERMIYILLSDLASAFDPVTAVNFQYERMENDPRFVSIALPNNTAVIADFTIGIERRKGTMKIVMPYRTLEPVKSQLAQQLLGESFGEYSAWTKHFSDSVRVSSVEMEAVLADFQSTLQEAFSWRKGSLLNIDVPLDPPITVRSGGTALFSATLGRKDGHLALRLRHRAEVRIEGSPDKPPLGLDSPSEEEGGNLAVKEEPHEDPHRAQDNLLDNALETTPQEEEKERP